MARHEFTGDTQLIDFDRQRVDTGRLEQRSLAALESGSLGAPGRSTPYKLPAEQELLSGPISQEAASLLGSNYYGENPFMPIGSYVVRHRDDIILALRRGTRIVSGTEKHSNDGGVTSADTMQIPPTSMQSLFAGLQAKRVYINEDSPQADHPDTWTQVQLDFKPDSRSLGMRGVDQLATTTVLALGDFGVDPSDPRLDNSTASIVSKQTGEKDHKFPVVGYPAEALMMRGSEYGSFIVIDVSLDPDIELANTSQKFSKIFRIPRDMVQDVINKTADPDTMARRIRLADGSELETLGDAMAICGGFCIKGVQYVLKEGMRS